MLLSSYRGRRHRPHRRSPAMCSSWFVRAQHDIRCLCEGGSQPLGSTATPLAEWHGPIRPSRRHQGSRWRSKVTALDEPGAVATLDFRPHERPQGICGCPRIWVRVEAYTALRSDTAPMAHEKGTAEQVRPDLHPVEPPFIALGPNAGERRTLREERQLDQCRTTSEFCKTCHASSLTWSGVSASGNVRFRRARPVSEESAFK